MTPSGSSPGGFSIPMPVRAAWRFDGSPSVRAMTWMKFAPSANVHQYLLPVITQWSSSIRARQVIDEMSDPTSGSDIASAPRYLPSAISRIRFRRSSPSNGIER